MGRHSRRGPAPKGDASSAIEGTDPAAGGTQDVTGTGGFAARPRPRPRGGESWSAGSQGASGATVSGAGRHVPSDRRADDRAPGAFGSARGGHPEQREQGGGWGEFENQRATPAPFPR
ncbi:hypothetical protein GT028_07220, partial [Streptomyces sp. SID2999]|nr:hypothetical protein [Streptomyces sp. SID2999]